MAYQDQPSHSPSLDVEGGAVVLTQGRTGHRLVTRLARNECVGSLGCCTPDSLEQVSVRISRNRDRGVPEDLHTIERSNPDASTSEARA